MCSGCASAHNVHMICSEKSVSKNLLDAMLEIMKYHTSISGSRLKGQS